MLNKLIRLNRDDLWVCCGVPAGIFLVIHIISLFAVRFSGEGTSLLLSGAILPIVCGIVILFVTPGHVCVTFPQAVQFGQTRRRALGLTLSLVLFQALCSMGLAALLTVVERAIFPIIWKWVSGAQVVAIGRESAAFLPPGVPRSQGLTIEDFSLGWRWFLLIALGALVLGFIIGAVIQRYGGRGGWVLYGLWMVFFICFRFLPWKQYTIVDWLVPLLLLLAAGGLIWSVRSLLQATIR